MHRATLIALALLPSAAAAQAPSLDVSRARDGWRVEVINPSEAPILLTEGRPRLTRPLVRVDVRQSDGRWVRAAALTASHFEDAPLEVPARGRLRLAPRRYAWPRFLESPGRYRLVVFERTDRGPRTIARELEVRGWSRATLARAWSMVGWAEAAGCGELARRMERVALERGDVGALVERYEGEADLSRRASMALPLLRRGSFVAELEQTLAMGPWDEARPLVRALAPRPRHMMRRLRRAAAARVARRLATDARVPPETYGALEELSDAWTGPVYDAVALRLRAGPDEGAEARALVELLVFGSVSPPREAQRAELLSSLDARCRGAAGALADRCEDARSRLAPRGCVVPFFGRSRRLRGIAAPRPRRAPACRALRRSFRELVAAEPGPIVTLVAPDSRASAGARH